MSINSLAIELADALQTWRRAKNCKPLVELSKKMAEEMGIVGGAFGIANRGDNTFDLLRHYPQSPLTEDFAVFPYIRKKASDLPGDVKEVEANFSEWMHQLFSVQRERQQLEPSSAFEVSTQSVALKVPEFFRHLIGNENDISPRPYILVSHADITATLAAWLYIWRCAAISERGLATTVGMARRNKAPPFLSRTVLKLVKDVMDRSLQIKWLRDELSNLPEHQFLTNDISKVDWGSDANSITFGRRLADSVSISDMMERFNNESEIVAQTLLEGQSDVTLFELLRQLHYKALFPIIPYLFLTIAYKFGINQCILPLLNSVEFPIEVLIGGSKADDRPEQKTMFCSVVFLATLDARVSHHKDLALWSLLLRQAAEPFIDTVFYGGIQRRYIQQETYGEFFRSITHELGGLNLRLHENWLSPITECFDGLIDVRDERRAPFGSISVASESQKAIANFRVVTVPTVYSAAARHFALWTSRNWLAIMKIASDMSFDDALGRIIQAAGESHFIRWTFTNVGRDEILTPEGIELWESKCRAESEKNADRLAAGLTSTLEGKNEKNADTNRVRWLPADSKFENESGLTGTEQAQIFCRLFVAICTNALKNAEPEHPIQIHCSLNRTTKVLTVTQKNPCNLDPSPPKPDGTKSVLLFLVRSLKGKVEDIRFERLGKDWLTQCRVPAHFLYIPEFDIAPEV